MQSPELANFDTLFFLDLDDTLFQTRHKNPAGKWAATRADDPERISYMTPAQSALWELFSQAPHGLVIPVTARDLRQFRNTFLAGHPAISQAVLYFGGLILRDGRADPEWRAHIQSLQQTLDTPVAELWKAAREVLANRAGFRLYDVDGYYLAVKAARDCPERLREEVFASLSELLPSGYALHRNGRALSLYPRGMDKQHAVAYLVEKYRPRLTLGAGDSLSDLSFMQCCDFLLIPQNSQLAGGMGKLGFGVS